MAKSPELYVDRSQFYEAMNDFYAQYVAAKSAGLPRPRPSNYIGKCITNIATNLARSHKYSGYSYKDEMISDAIENAIAYIHCFDPNKSKNPFAYFTRVTLYAFWRRISLEKGIQHKKYIAMQLALLTNGDEVALGKDKEKMMIDFGIQDHIDEYEAKAKQKKDKKDERARNKKAESAGSDSAGDGGPTDH